MYTYLHLLVCSLTVHSSLLYYLLLRIELSVEQFKHAVLMRNHSHVDLYHVMIFMHLMITKSGEES